MICIDDTKMRTSRLKPSEEAIFDAVCNILVAKNIFRARTPEELRALKAHHYVLRIKDFPLGGFSLIPQDDGWYELSALWSGQLGNGIGKRLVESAKQKAKKDGRRLYALSTVQKLIPLFTGGGMTFVGTLSKLQAKGMPLDFPSSLREYDTSARDPNLFVL